jgi:hypothetical protein
MPEMVNEMVMGFLTSSSCVEQLTNEMTVGAAGVFMINGSVVT